MPSNRIILNEMEGTITVQKYNGDFLFHFRSVDEFDPALLLTLLIPDLDIDETRKSIYNKLKQEFNPDIKTTPFGDFSRH